MTATDKYGAVSEPATLKVTMPQSLPLSGDFKILKPRNGIYLFGIKILPFIGQTLSTFSPPTEVVDDTPCYSPSFNTFQ